MEISVADAAERLSIDPSRVRALLRCGGLSGRRVGRMWLVDADAVALRAEQPVAAGRPLAPWRAWALLAALEAASGRRVREGGPLVRSPSPSRVPVSQLLGHLRSGELIDAPAARWRDLLAARAEVFDVHGHPAAIRRLMTHPGTLVGGAAEAARHGADLVVVADRHPEIYVSGPALEALSLQLFLRRERLPPAMVWLVHADDRSGAGRPAAPAGALGAVEAPQSPAGVGPGRVVIRVPAGDPWPGSRALFPPAGWTAPAPRGGRADGAHDAGGRVWASVLAADLLDAGDVRAREAGRRLLSQMASAAVGVLAHGRRGALSWVVESRPEGRHW